MQDDVWPAQPFPKCGSDTVGRCSRRVIFLKSRFPGPIPDIPSDLEEGSLETWAGPHPFPSLLPVLSSR